MEWAWITFQFPTSVSHLVLEELRDTVAGARSGVFGRMLACVHLLNPTTLMRLNQRISWSSMWVAKHSSCQNLLSTWMHEQRKEVERAVATSGEYRIVSHYSNLACLGYKSSKITKLSESGKLTTAGQKPKRKGAPKSPKRCRIY